MVKRRGRKESESEELHVNLTPLIDVALVLLIMFIVIAPLLELDRVELATAAPDRQKELTAAKETSPIAIHVQADNSIWFRQRQVTPEQLISLLKEAKRQNPQRIPQLFHDKKACFGTYQSVKNAAEVAGFTEMDVILKPN